MDGDKFTLLDELKDQNDENGNSEPQQSQPQVYQTLLNIITHLNLNYTNHLSLNLKNI